MQRIWYIHKWWHGRYRGCHRVQCLFTEAEAHARRLRRMYGSHGWTYDVDGTAAQPGRADELVELGAGI